MIKIAQQAKPHSGSAGATQVGFRRHLLTTLQLTGKGLSVTCRVMEAQKAASPESSFGTLKNEAKVG